MDNKKISILMTYWLRHCPESAGLRADDYGWINLSNLIDALKLLDDSIGLEKIKEIIYSSGKKRFDIDYKNNRIRAAYGHSFPITIENDEQPPEILYHGTATKNLQGILNEGLLPIKRQFVHLTTDIKTAYETGARHGKPVVIKIKSGEMMRLGYDFYKTNDVWLTGAVPSEFLDFSLINEKKMPLTSEQSNFGSK